MIKLSAWYTVKREPMHLDNLLFTYIRATDHSQIAGAATLIDSETNVQSIAAADPASSCIIIIKVTKYLATFMNLEGHHSVQVWLG
jgi:hypothetical protein